jgi:ubiquinone/menaquinone biosynthesis C-methylase UbiE
MVVMFLGLVAIWLGYILIIERILHYNKKKPCPAKDAGLFNTRLRKIYQPSSMLKEGLELKPGMRVLEIGPGTGAFTTDVAKAIEPDGHLFAIDVQEEMLRLLEETLKSENIINVTPIRGDVMDQIQIESGLCDAVFAVTVLPEIPDPVIALTNIRKILKPEGLFATGEIFLDPDFPMRGTVKNWAAQAGFRFKKSLGNALRYVLVFENPRTSSKESGSLINGVIS